MKKTNIEAVVNLENMIDMMTDYEANINFGFRNFNNMTALMNKAKNGTLEEMKFLLEKGANPNTQDNLGYAPLHFVLKFRGGLIKIEMLLEHGANPNLQDNLGNSSLHFALRFGGDINIIKMLLKHGANPHLLNKKGDNLFIVASRYCNSSIQELLKMY